MGTLSAIFWKIKKFRPLRTVGALCLMLEMNADYFPNLKENGRNNKPQLCHIGDWNWMFIRSLDEC
jgi:hypothetical protein